jgi:CTP:molybdopterin cytidylyltransferase MocA
MSQRVGCAILAAGGSRRLGRPKQLLPFRGRTLLEHVIERVRSSDCDVVAVVLGAESARIGSCVPKTGVETLLNPEWAEGLASSVRCAARWALHLDLRALLLATADQPYLHEHHLNRLLEQHAGGQTLVASRYAGTFGVPALFDRSHLDALLALRGDRGAGALLRRAQSVTGVDFPAGAIDIDTPDDLAAFESDGALQPPAPSST